MYDKKEQALNFISNNTLEMLNLWQNLVNIQSGPGNKMGADEVTHKIINELSEIPLNITHYEYENVGNFYTLEYCVEKPKGTILLIGHSDTVFLVSSDNERRFFVDKDKAYGPGVLDMKGGLVIGTYAIKALYESGYSDCNIKFCIAGDEETAHMHSDCDKNMIDAMSGAIAAFNMETGFLDNSIVVARKGGMVCQIDIKGVAAHTGNNPDKGISAIWEMANKINEIQNLTDKEKGILYNVGKVSGGIGSNTFPDEASMIVGVRYSKVEHEKEIFTSLEKVVNKVNIKGTNSTLKFLGKIHPMEESEGNLRLFEIVKKSALEIEMKMPNPKRIGGASDSAYSVIAGVPTVCAMGVQGEFNHSKEEYADVNSLYERSKLLICSILNVTQ